MRLDKFDPYTAKETLRYEGKNVRSRKKEMNKRNK